MESEIKARDLSFLSDNWKTHLAAEFEKPYFEDIRSFLKKELRQGHTFFPAKENVFRAFKLVDFTDVRVVIIGQDPYHGIGQANGLAFAVEQGISTPPSLQNIFKEIENDIGKGRPTNTTLESWARQGVLLLNTVLTVRAHTAFSHREKGWEKFTNCVIEKLNNKTTPIIFMLWGAAAQAKASMIKNPIHKILKAPHPSPLSAHRGFLGCKHFSKANEILKNYGISEIDWTL